MKIKTSKVAAQLNIHPSHVLQHVAEISNSLAFNDVWPEIEECWVETITVASGHKIIEKNTLKTVPSTITVNSEQNLSTSAMRVLDKLIRQGKWGNVSVSLEALVNLTHLSRHESQDAIVELNKIKFLDQNGKRRGTISLDPSKRKEIEHVLQNKE